MVYYRKSPSQIWCSRSYARPGNNYGFYSKNIRFYDLDQMEQISIDLDRMYEQPGFTPLNWNDVYHQKSSGYVWANVQTTGIALSPDAPHLEPGQSGSIGMIDLGGSDAAVASGDIGIDVRLNTRGDAIYVGYAASHIVKYISKGVQTRRVRFGVGNTIIARSYNSKTKKYSWSSIKGSWDLFSPSVSRNYPTAEEAVAACIQRIYAQASLVDWRNVSYQFNPDDPGAIRLYSLNTFESRVTPSMVEDYLRHDSALLRSRAIEWFSTVEPALHATSFDSTAKFDGNLLVLTSKLNDFGQVTLGSLYDLVKSDATPKDIASFWLANRYGDRLSVGGFADLVRSVSDEFLTIHAKTTRFIRGKARQTASISDGYLSCSLHACCDLAITPKDSNEFMKLIRSAYEWGFYPSLGNVWDAVPLSFVVDWLVNVGDIYKSVDRMVRARYYNVAAILQSVKAEAVDPVFPNISLSFYRREVGHSLRLGVDSVKLGLPGVINIVDSAALICG